MKTWTDGGSVFVSTVQYVIALLGYYTWVSQRKEDWLMFLSVWV